MPTINQTRVLGALADYLTSRRVMMSFRDRYMNVLGTAPVVFDSKLDGIHITAGPMPWTIKHPSWAILHDEKGVEHIRWPLPTSTYLCQGDSFSDIIRVS
jgi:hypothetical protein